MQSFRCYLGVHESHRYTFEAEDLNDLKAKVAKAWPTFSNEWEEREVEEGYPKGSRKFIINDKKSWPNLGNCKSFILIIPERKDA